MTRIFAAALLACLTAGVGFADNHEGHVYKKAASVHDIMEYMVEPAMDKIKAYREAGGPSDKDEWKKAHGAVSMVLEATQLALMGGRVKDDAWLDGANQVVAAAQETMTSAYRMDAAGYYKGLKAMSAGCKTCHKVHKEDD